MPNKFNWNEIGAEAVGAGVANVGDILQTGGALMYNSLVAEVGKTFLSGGITALASNQPLSEQLPGLIGQAVGNTIEAEIDDSAVQNPASNDVVGKGLIGGFSRH